MRYCHFKTQYIYNIWVSMLAHIYMSTPHYTAQSFRAVEYTDCTSAER